MAVLSYDCLFKYYWRMSNKLDPKVAEAVMLKAGLKPLEPYTNNRDPWKSECLKCKREVHPAFSTIQQGGGCVYCAGRKVDPKEAKATMLNAGLEPLEPFISSKSKWKCIHIACGKIVHPAYRDIRAGFGGCKSCGYIKGGIAQRKSQQEVMKDMLEAGLVPLESYVNSSTKWKCIHEACGKVVYPSYDSIKQGRGGCKSCSDKDSGFRRRNSQQSTIEIMLFAKLKPLEPYETNKTPWKCICLECGKIVRPTFNGVRSGQGCLYCGRKLAANSRRLPEHQAVEIMLKANLKPLEPYRGTNYPWKCQCLKCGKNSLPRLSHIKIGVSCTYCSGTKVDAEDAVEIMLGAGLKPLKPYKNSHAVWKSECLNCGAIVMPRFSDVQNGSGCKICGIEKRSVLRKTPEELAVAVMLKAKAKPLEPYFNNKSPWKSECLKCGEIIYPAYANVNSGSSPCVYCSPAGIKYDKSAYLYILFHPILQSIKVGISNQEASENRIVTFTKEDWRVFRTFNVTSGRDASFVEKETFRWLRKDLGLGVHLSKSEMKRGGWSETVDANEISVMEIARFIDKLIKGLQK